MCPLFEIKYKYNKWESLFPASLKSLQKAVYLNFQLWLALQYSIEIDFKLILSISFSSINFLIFQVSLIKIESFIHKFTILSRLRISIFRHNCTSINIRIKWLIQHGNSIWSSRRVHSLIRVEMFVYSPLYW